MNVLNIYNQSYKRFIKNTDNFNYRDAWEVKHAKKLLKYIAKYSQVLKCEYDLRYTNKRLWYYIANFDWDE